MPKGKTTLYFRGGPVDGQAIEGACNRIYASLRIPYGSGFTEESDGRIGVFTNASELPENWTAYKASNYSKEETASGKAGVVYSFTGSLMVDRCRAITKKGDWCKNESADGKSVCKTHARSEEVELRPS